MTDKLPSATVRTYVVEIAEIRRYEVPVWCVDASEALETGRKLWREADYVSKYETSEVETEYTVRQLPLAPATPPDQRED